MKDFLLIDTKKINIYDTSKKFIKYGSRFTD